MRPRALLQAARADFRERVRRPAYLVTLAAALWLGGAVVNGMIRMRLGEWRGVYNSAWIGVLMAMTGSLFVSLVGFYIVKGSVDRDRVTRVGEVLAATPIGKPLYLLAKALSNLAVFATILLVLFGSGLFMQLFAGEDRRVDIVKLAAPLLVLTLPALAVIAAIAVLFECIPFLRGGFGNVAYFFLWGMLLTVPLAGNRGDLDITGIDGVQRELKAAVGSHDTSFDGGFSLNAGPGAEKITKTFVWNGLTYTPKVFVQRLGTVAFAGALVLLAALLFDRFDSAPRGFGRKKKAKEPESGSAEGALAPRAAAVARMPVHLTPLPSGAHHARLFGLYIAELKLILKGVSWWWLLGAAGLVVAALTSPLESARHQVLALTWLWPVLLWSGLGSREARSGTEALVFSVPRPIGRQLAAAWLAGVTVALLTGVGVAIRLAGSGETGSLLGFFTGALFIPALAFTLGAWSGTAKLFEGLYTALWYIGPMQGRPAPVLDFMGVSKETVAGGTTWIYLAVTAGLLALAALGRGRRLRAL